MKNRTRGWPSRLHPTNTLKNVGSRMYLGVCMFLRFAECGQRTPASGKMAEQKFGGVPCEGRCYPRMASELDIFRNLRRGHGAWILRRDGVPAGP